MGSEMCIRDRLKAIGLEYSSSTVRRWFEAEGAHKVARRIKPSLSETQKKWCSRMARAPTRERTIQRFVTVRGWGGVGW